MRNEWPELLRKALAEFTGPIADIRQGSRRSRRSSIDPLFALMMREPWHAGRTSPDRRRSSRATTPHSCFRRGPRG